MNLTFHASGSVQLGEGQPPRERSLSMDVAMLPPEDGSTQGSIVLTISDNLSSNFSLKLKLTAMQAAQLGTQLTELAQDAQHALSSSDVSRVILSKAPSG